MESLSDLVKRRRRDLGLSHRDVAELMGVSKGYVGDMEREKNTPIIPRTQKRLATALNVPIGDIERAVQISRCGDLIKAAVGRRLDEMSYAERLELAQKMGVLEVAE